MKNTFLCLLVTFIFISCNQTKHPAELNYSYGANKWELLVYDGNSLYDGEVWSDDNKSYKLFIDSGLLQKIEYYHSNGNVFCRVQFQEKIFYSIQGNEISRDDARDIYEDRYWQFKAEQRNLKKIVQNNMRQ